MKFCIICKSIYTKSNFKKYCSQNCYLQSNRPSKNAIIAICEYCGESVLKYKGHLIGKIFCNRECSGKAQSIRPGFNKQISKLCANCQKSIQVKISNTYTRKDKLEKLNFCSKHCKGIYDSTLIKGIYDPNHSFVKNRSALEKFIEEKICLTFPYIKFLVNNRSVLGLELDFYFPDLNFAIEINGVVHYQPIYGENTLMKIQEKDLKKIQLCNERNIKLLSVKSITRFYDSVGESVWNEQIKPELLKLIPFCEVK